MDGQDDENRSVYNTPMQSDSQNTAERSQDSLQSLPNSPSYRTDRTRQSTPSALSQAFLTPTSAATTASSSSIFGSGDDGYSQQPATSEIHPTLSVSPPTPASFPSPAPIAALQGARKRRDSWNEVERGPLVARRRIPKVEKDADDPTNPPSSSRAGMTRQESTTLTTLSRLFAVRAPTSPEASRTSSYIQPIKPATPYTRSLAGETSALPDHLYSRGLLEGRHSDITIHAFGHQYKLHRLILDRAPFFRSALSEPWLESNAEETTLHPEDIDSTITQGSFELALKRLYGCGSPADEDHDAVGLFATGCWLEMPDLIESSIESMLRQMTPETLSPLMKLVTSNYYGRAGDKILASAKAMLCRDGWKMPLRFWDGIPGDIIREIVGGDGFFIDGEWDRWVLAKRILDRRLKKRALDAGLVEPGTRRKVLKVPESANLMAVRFDTPFVRNGLGRQAVPDNLHQWVTLYTHPDVEPILVLLDEGIHYIHLDFEQLQLIRNAYDFLGLPVMPEKVISNALWQQMELRQKVMNARDVDMELDLSVKSNEDATVAGAGRDTTMSIVTPTSPPGSAKGKHKAEDVHESVEEEIIESGSWDGNGKPRKFWIPSSDCNIVMGGNADPVIATSNNTTLQRHASRLSATVQPEDVQWVSDFAAVTSQPRENGASAPGAGIGEVRYTHFPPFRFAAEFPNPRLLKEKKRVYSRTVFYAGSLWNIYIQKVNSSKSKQLGVYLHRAKERETEEVIAGTAGLGQGSVDERIGQLEREMILGSERRERRHRRRTAISGDGLELDGAESSGSDLDISFNETTSSAKPNSMRGLLSRARRRKSGHTDSTAVSHQSLSSNSTTGGPGLMTPDTDSEESNSDSERLVAASARCHVPTLPPYVDARPTIKTYFKIYSPSRGGRMLSVYESAPDRFNFSQSWGWKSASLMLDEGLLGTEPLDDKDEGVDGNLADAGRGKRDGALRFTVVLGNI